MTNTRVRMISQPTKSPNSVPENNITINIRDMQEVDMVTLLVSVSAIMILFSPPATHLRIGSRSKKCVELLIFNRKPVHIVSQVHKYEWTSASSSSFSQKECLTWQPDQCSGIFRGLHSSKLESWLTKILPALPCSWSTCMDCSSSLSATNHSPVWRQSSWGTE